MQGFGLDVRDLPGLCPKTNLLRLHRAVLGDADEVVEISFRIELSYWGELHILRHRANALDAVKGQVQNAGFACLPAEDEPTVAELLEYIGGKDKAVLPGVLEAVVGHQDGPFGRYGFIERRDVVEAGEAVVLFEIDDRALLVSHGAHVVFQPADDVFHTREGRKAAELFQYSHGIDHHSSILLRERYVGDAVVWVFVGVVLVFLHHYGGVIA